MLKKIILLIISNAIVFTQTLFFSEYAEGSSNHKYLEIYNSTNQTIDLSQYAEEVEHVLSCNNSRNKHIALSLWSFAINNSTI